ncbi:MAG: hypothetical protein M8357_02685 [Desulfobulbaceae bacterium]|nr:hypothetical protein [Desulfobulbaceae bacterium]
MTKKLQQSVTQTSAAQDGMEQNLSRRRFLNTAGCAAVGGLMVAAGGTLLTNKGAKAEDPPAAPPLPWKYTELDPLEAGKRGYKSYLEKGG